MTNLRVATATVQKQCDAVVDDIDLGLAAGTIKIYDGVQPANANTIVSTQVLLGTLTFSDPAFGAANASGVAAASAIAGDAAADATGTATWARIADSNGLTKFDCDVGLIATTIVLDSVSIILGGTINITAFTITQPSGV